MPLHQLVIAPAATTDLKDIYQYGLRHWGQTQSESYLESIKEQFWTLAEQPLIGIDRSQLLSGARSIPIESQTLLYRVTTDSVEIIRVLHGRQDPQRHLK
jgi:toxin ParE1/3/4